MIKEDFIKLLDQKHSGGGGGGMDFLNQPFAAASNDYDDFDGSWMAS